MDEVIQADVPLEPIGIANGVKNMGGLLEQNLRSLAIECLPRDLPDVITVDVSALNIGDAIHVREIPVAGGRDDAGFNPISPPSRSSRRRWRKSRLPPRRKLPPGPEVIREKKEEPEAAAAAAGRGAEGKRAEEVDRVRSILRLRRLLH